VAAIVYTPSWEQLYMLKHSWTLSCSIVNKMNCYCAGGCHRNIRCLYAYTGCQLLVYRHLRLNTTQTTQYTSSKIVHTELTLIITISQGACRFLIWLQRRSILHLWLSAFKLHTDYTWCKIQKCWHSVDAHFRNGADSVSLFTLIIMAANESKNDNDIPQ
jgi:hypothetical protein